MVDRPDCEGCIRRNPGLRTLLIPLRNWSRTMDPCTASPPELDPRPPRPCYVPAGRSTRGYKLAPARIAQKRPAGRSAVPGRRRQERGGHLRVELAAAAAAELVQGHL